MQTKSPSFVYERAHLKRLSDIRYKYRPIIRNGKLVDPDDSYETHCNNLDQNCQKEDDFNHKKVQLNKKESIDQQSEISDRYSFGNHLRVSFSFASRFEDMPGEQVFAEVILLEVQEFISCLYGTIVRFYMPSVNFEILEDLTEDLIEIATSMTINSKLSPWLMKLCRLATREDERLLTEKIYKFDFLQPENLGITNFFTCNKSSKLVQMLAEISKNLNRST